MLDSLKNVQITNSNNYAQSFLHTLSNFCSKCPLQPKINYVEDMGRVYVTWGEGKSFDFVIDPMNDKKDVIKELKTLLQKDYPILYEKKITTLPAEEIEKLVDNGVSLSDALGRTVTEYIPKYRVVRVHHQYNELDLFDLTSRMMYKFHSKLPVTAILEDIKYNPKDNEEVFNSLTLLYRMDKKEGNGTENF